MKFLARELGAFLAMFFLSLWMMRRHLWVVLMAAFKPGSARVVPHPQLDTRRQAKQISILTSFCVDIRADEEVH